MAKSGAKKTDAASKAAVPVGATSFVMMPQMVPWQQPVHPPDIDLHHSLISSAEDLS
jgi:hypothetical protein